ncbi:MAG: hypothetical protein VR64_11830 [Desulfatitalea sp. BRH_c12]|nr:MAG: hypothetical protein VR64_11830 [Desulfatitalea sp. BRH_c12]
MRSNLFCVSAIRVTTAAALRLLRMVSVLTVVIVLVSPVGSRAEDPAPLSANVETALDYLIALSSSTDGTGQVDLVQVAPLAAFIREAPAMTAFTPGERRDAKGSFITYRVNRSLPEIIRYMYNRKIPEGAVNPSSIDHSFWKEQPGCGQDASEIWKALHTLSEPVIAKGLVREFISPDIHTGAYYEYDLLRTFLLYRQGSSRAVISLSNQVGTSEVGRKGFIVGDDQDWNYLYTQEKGLNKAGLGWVKSRIYTFFSVCFYIEDDARPGVVQIGVFQWLGAGAVGLNLVDSHHIQNGLKRYAEQFKGMLESARMPEPMVLERMYTTLDDTPEAILREKALDVIRHIKHKAANDRSLAGNDAIREMDEKAYIERMDKNKLLSILMREYVKFCLGKETPLTPEFGSRSMTAPLPENTRLHRDSVGIAVALTQDH